MANYEIISKIQDAQGHFTGMVVTREAGWLFKKLRYYLAVKNNESGRETIKYHLMDNNEGPLVPKAVVGRVCIMSMTQFTEPVFTESGLEASVNACTYVSTYPLTVNKKKLRKVVIPRDKFPK